MRTVVGSARATHVLIALVAVAASTVGLIAVLGAVIATMITSSEPAAFETSPILEYGLPIAKSLMNTAIALCIGAVTLAGLVFRDDEKRRAIALDIGAAGAMCAMVLASATAVLVFADMAGPVEASMFLVTLGHFLTQIAAGQGWLATVLAFAIIAVLAFSARSVAASLGVALVAVLALIPLALQGHAAGAGRHVVASTALWLHVAGTSVWIGGLVTLAVMVARDRSRDLGLDVLVRFSRVALSAFMVVLVAGAVAGALRLDAPHQLISTPYGQLLLAKIVVLAVLGALGAVHRRWVFRRWPLAGTPAVFWRIALLELILMGAAVGLAGVLARTPPPVLPTIAVSPAELLSGLALPLPLALERTWETFVPDALWLLIAGFGAFTYGIAVSQRGRGGWPPSRSVAAAVAALLMIIATCGWVAVYGTYLLSVNAFGVVVLTTAVPAAIVLSQPHQLIQRARVESHDRASFGLRRSAHFFAAGFLLAGAFVVALSPQTVRWTVEDPVGAQFTRLLLLLSGLYFATCVRRSGDASRVEKIVPWLLPAFTLVLIGTGMSTGPLFSPDWFAVITEGWETDPAADQQRAGIFITSVGLAGLVAPLTIEWFHVHVGRRRIAKEAAMVDAR